MKTLELNRMENIHGKSCDEMSPGAAFACGFGIVAAVGLFAIIGPLSLLAVSTCIVGDSGCK